MAISTTERDRACLRASRLNTPTFATIIYLIAAPVGDLFTDCYST